MRPQCASTNVAPSATRRAERYVATASTRYEQKREQILDAATTFINQRGASGMTMRDVGDAVGLTPASLTYYFKNKETLAEAVFNKRLDSLDYILTEAARKPTPLDRVDTLLGLELERLANVLAGRTPPLAALPNPSDNGEFAAVHKRTQALFRRINDLFVTDGDETDRNLSRARSYMVIGLIFFMHTWLGTYPTDEFPRIHARIMDLLCNGIAKGDFRWNPQIFEVDGEPKRAEERDKPEFLRTATRLLNTNGYLGTSVDMIADELSVTKGSFYHHLTSKDELISEAVRSNFDRIAAAIKMARSAGGNQIQQLTSAIATLVDLQFRPEWPLLRSVAFATLPRTLRAEVDKGSQRTAMSFASLLIDGIIEGSVRPIDPLITGHIINSTLYSAVGLQAWSTRLQKDRAIALYASTLIYGLFDDDVLCKLDQPEPEQTPL